MHPGMPGSGGGKMDREMILLVHTSGHAFSIEKALKKRNISCRLTPIPRKVSSDCGICVRFSEKDLEGEQRYRFR